MRLMWKHWRSLAAMSLIAAVIGYPSVQASASSLPFNDPNVNGFLGLCDRNGHPITSGNVDDVPFVWTAVSSTPAPSGYEHGKATLYAYQPRQQVDPGEWSGKQMTASSAFTNPAHPMAQATNGDSPLLWFVQGYPPQWDGLVQLRMYYSGVNMPVSLSPYPATVLKISGNRWSVVTGGSLSCDLGKATSAESQMLPAAQLASPQTLDIHNGTAGSGGGTTANTSNAAGSNASPTSSNTSSDSGSGTTKPHNSLQAGSASPGSGGGGGLSTGALIGVILAIAAAIGAVAFALWRRRIRAGT